MDAISYYPKSQVPRSTIGGNSLTNPQDIIEKICGARHWVSRPSGPQAAASGSERSSFPYTANDAPGPIGKRSSLSGIPGAIGPAVKWEEPDTSDDSASSRFADSQASDTSALPAGNGLPDTDNLPASPSPAGVISRILLHESIIEFGREGHTFDRNGRTLEIVVKTLLEHPESTVEIGAHTDRTGSRDYNERLSRRRARAVKSFLVEKGIARMRIWWKGYGSSQPRDLGNTPTARAKNRRAEIRIWGHSM
ncbi:MAG: Outer membrane protein OmpA [Candidatus Kentron sp. G]|nr:MAG: Outer membrane protein OmpA [Candidatus Kentron sp. G]VFN05879.1 MAG: Outer membrane protein OmpA [Candidatus Kentron sp. G]VFN06234.1 MAG: Outer membrane protein OmpA [Candidatus Kentron sp. G]